MSDNYFSDLRSSLRSYILAGSTVSGLISSRFYPSDSGAIKDPVYPLANFKLNSGIDDEHAHIMKINFDLWTHATNSFDGSLSIYSAIRNRIHRQLISNSTLSFVPYENQPPVEEFDVVHRIYTVHGRFSGWMLVFSNISA